MKKLLLTLCLLFTAFAYPADSKTPPVPAQTQNIPAQPSAPLEKPSDTTQVPAPLPSSEEMTTSYEGAFVRMLVTLLGIVFLVFATFWILRRLGSGKFKMGSSRAINVIEKRALSPKSMLYVVEIGGKRVLISESQAEVRALATLEPSSDSDSL